jgi:2-polyprenyl-3-methyl-5-hydroxy-6-metoxy-1,4-benzoquinol methylase
MALRYDSAPLLQRLIGHFQVQNLQMDQAQFRTRLEDYLNNRVEIAGRPSPAPGQRPQSSSFFWGHDHDFGEFQLPGLLGTRHIWLLSRFFDHFGLSPDEVSGKDVLDVGCWTGGVSLILERLGARVTSVDDAAQYPHALNFMVDAFGLDSLTAMHKSLYALGEESFLERYDTVFCMGVLYHVTDPVVALRRLYHALKPGGRLCVESMSIDSDQPMCKYEGPGRHRPNSGWNWFVPSPKTLQFWLEDSGFEDVRIGNGVDELAVTKEGDPLGSDRCLAVARKRAGHEIIVAGLSTVIP